MKAPTKRARSRNICDAYKGEGIQHIACACRDIYETVATLRSNGLDFMPAPPDAYYDALERALPGHGEPMDSV